MGTYQTHGKLKECYFHQRQNKSLSIANGALQTTQQNPWTEPLDLEQSLETHSSLGLNEAGSLIKGWKMYLNKRCYDCRIVAPHGF